MAEIDFDEILHLNDPDFAKKFAAAIGLKEGESVEFYGPQFERTDGVMPALPDCFERLRSLPAETLRGIGCGVWDSENPPLMLFPKEWYDTIPEGYELEVIDGKVIKFERGVTDNDYRFGCLAYGIRPTL